MRDYVRALEVEHDTHSEVKRLGKLLRAKTRLPHPAYVVVRLAIDALKREIASKEAEM